MLVRMRRPRARSPRPNSHVKSDAIVLAQRQRIVGVGAAQMFRVQRVHIACDKAGDRVHGGVMASDGFFLFPTASNRRGAPGHRSGAARQQREGRGGDRSRQQGGHCDVVHWCATLSAPATRWEKVDCACGRPRWPSSWGAARMFALGPAALGPAALGLAALGLAALGPAALGPAAHRG